MKIPRSQALKTAELVVLPQAQMPAQLPDMRPPKAEPKDKAKNQEDEKQKAKERKARDEALTCVLSASPRYFCAWKFVHYDGFSNIDVGKGGRMGKPAYSLGSRVLPGGVGRGDGEGKPKLTPETRSLPGLVHAATLANASSPCVAKVRPQVAMYRAGHPASSKEEAARQQKLKLQAAAYAARRDLGLAGKSGSASPPPPLPHPTPPHPFPPSLLQGFVKPIFHSPTHHKATTEEIAEQGGGGSPMQC